MFEPYDCRLEFIPPFLLASGDDKLCFEPDEIVGFLGSVLRKWSSSVEVQAAGSKSFTRWKHRAIFLSLLLKWEGSDLPPWPSKRILHSTSRLWCAPESSPYRRLLPSRLSMTLLDDIRTQSITQTYATPALLRIRFDHMPNREKTIT